MCSFIVLMPSVRIYNVNSHENKENALNEKVCPNFWPVLYVYMYLPTSTSGAYWSPFTEIKFTKEDHKRP